jgi:hypothetical protein
MLILVQAVNQKQHDHAQRLRDKWGMRAFMHCMRPPSTVCFVPQQLLVAANKGPGIRKSSGLWYMMQFKTIQNEPAGSK